MLLRRIASDRSDTAAIVVAAQVANYAKSASNLSEAQVKQFVEVAKLAESSRPWYERALSTIGVIAFVALTTGAVVQSISASVQQAKSERLADEQRRFEAERAIVDQALADISSAVLADPLTLRRGWDKALDHRLAALDSKSELSAEELAECFQILVLRRDYPRAAKLIDQNSSSISAEDPNMLVILAEYRLMSGMEQVARKYVDEVTERRDGLSLGARLRWLALRSYLGEPLDSLIPDVRNMLRVSDGEAREVLEARVSNLSLGRRNLDPARQ
jgi:hypothetical protein